MTSKNLCDIPVKELRELFDSVDNILCDNDGVLSIFGVLLPGVKECVNRFRESGKSVKIITNNSAIGGVMLSALFTKHGLACQPSDIITPTNAIIDYLKNIHFKGKVWIHGFENMQKEFQQAGFTLAESEDPKTVTLFEMQQYFSNMDTEIKAVVVDFNVNMTFGGLAKTIRYLNNDPEMLLLFGNTDTTLPIVHNGSIIGPAYMQNILTEVTKRKPILLGKPSDSFGKYLTETLQCDPERTLFIGDSLESDIGFSKQMGFKQLLVLSGNTKIADLNICMEEYRPEYYVNSMDEVNSLLDKCKI